MGAWAKEKSITIKVQVTIKDSRYFYLEETKKLKMIYRLTFFAGVFCPDQNDPHKQVVIIH